MAADVEVKNEPLDFIREIVTEDLRNNKNDGKIVTRFPPEPNGYLHIGHAKAICLDFGVAAEYGGICNLRMDDTNPTKEDIEFVESIKEDVAWLGADWEDRLFYASDYFEQMYEGAVSNMLGAVKPRYFADYEIDEIPTSRQRILADLNQLAKREVQLMEKLAAEKAKYYDYVIAHVHNELKRGN